MRRLPSPPCRGRVLPARQLTPAGAAFAGGRGGWRAHSRGIREGANMPANTHIDLLDESSNSSGCSNASSVHQLALELAMLQQQGGGNSGDIWGDSKHNPWSSSASSSALWLGSTGRRSQNMTECVPVPTSEHVAEIVGRQGCKIKALRAKTNTYIKTPVRGEEPVFVVTGRKEDVATAKREILSAADHFTHIRATRNKNNALAFGNLLGNTSLINGATTLAQVRVPYRVVGLVVGPKGATIKRIQQQTHTYIVTPSRDKEPVFEVTGLPENVEMARKEIEAHIALRTGNAFNNSNGVNMPCWSTNDGGSAGSHDSGIGHSPPASASGAMAFDSNSTAFSPWMQQQLQKEQMHQHHMHVTRLLSELDLNGSTSEVIHNDGQQYGFVGSRSSLDLGTLARSNLGDHLDSLLGGDDSAKMLPSFGLHHDEEADRAAEDF